MQSRTTFIDRINALVSMFTFLMKRLNTGMNYVVLLNDFAFVSEIKYIYSKLDGTIHT